MINKLPNIILITVDCLRTDFLSLEKVMLLVPKMLKKNIVYFRNCIAAGPYTWASLPSIFTSQFPAVHNFGNVMHNFTVMHILRLLGYKSIAIVASTGTEYFARSILHYFDHIVRPGNKKVISNACTPRTISKSLSKFIEWILHHSKWYRPYVEFAWWDLLTTLRSLGIEFTPPFVKSSDVFSHVLRIIKHNKTPLFIWIHLVDLHRPYTNEAIKHFGIYEYLLFNTKLVFKMYLNYKKSLQRMIDRDTKFTLYESSKSLELMAKKLYSKSLEILVQQLRAFLNVLYEDKQERDTFVLLTADHGEGLFDHGVYDHVGVMTPFGFVPYLYQEVLNVPLIIINPNIEYRECTQQFVSHYDIAPTILEIATNKETAYKSICKDCIRFSRNSRGISLLKAEDGGFKIRDALIKTRKVIISESQALIKSIIHMKGRGRAYAIVYNNRYKLIWNPLIGLELFDLLKDPSELYNMYNDKPELAYEILSILYKHISYLPRLKIKYRLLSMQYNRKHGVKL